MATKNNDVSREMATQLSEEVKGGKEVMQMLMAEEREMYLEENRRTRETGLVKGRFLPLSALVVKVTKSTE